MTSLITPPPSPSSPPAPTAAGSAPADVSGSAGRHESPFRRDRQRYGPSDYLSNLQVRRLQFLLTDPEFHCLAEFRLGQALDARRRERPLTTLPAVVLQRLWRRRHRVVHHFNIDGRADIGPGFLIMHRTGVWIGPVQIGANCVIHHNVTIGERVAGGERGVPKIGSNVWIGPGAIITGDIEIGDGATISAGTVLSKSVPARCLVAGNPGRVIQTDYDNGLFNPVDS